MLLIGEFCWKNNYVTRIVAFHRTARISFHFVFFGFIKKWMNFKWKTIRYFESNLKRTFFLFSNTRISLLLGMVVVSESLCRQNSRVDFSIFFEWIFPFLYQISRFFKKELWAKNSMNRVQSTCGNNEDVTKWEIYTIN